MTGYLLAALRELVLDPQALVLDELGDPSERRAYVDPDAVPLNVEAQEIDLAPVSTTVLSESTGLSLELRHVITAALSVEHGDPAEAARLRDGITADLAVRFWQRRADLLARVDDGPNGTGQYGTRATLEVSYAPLVDDTLAEYALLAFTIDTTLDV